MDHPLVVTEHVGPLIAGGPYTDRNWLLDCFSMLPIPRGGRWLSLGCGSGGQELWGIAQGLFGGVHGVDGSPAAIAAGQAEAARQDIGAMSFELADLDIYAPGADAQFAGVTAVMTLSRLPDPARLLRAAVANLEPGGWLLVNDYVGPARFQAPDRVLQLVEDLILVLPDRLRRHTVDGSLREGWARHPIAFWETHAPREAVSSQLVRAAVADVAEVVLERRYGGTLLAPLLEQIVGNFRDNCEEDEAILRLLCRFEEILLREGVLESDFAVIAARRR
jgi:SAM-dependent methyltransferase